MPALVSVVVPVFNGARYLAECVGALLEQDHPSIEILVVDDGSTDDSASVAERFAGVRVLRRPHEGLAPTRNAGIQAASGSLVGFCDSDDRWLPQKARMQVEYLDAHPEIDLVLCRNETAFEDGVEAPDWLLPDQVRGDLDGVSPTSGLFRRPALERLGGFDTGVEVNGSDFNLLVRARTAGLGIGLLDQSLFVRRIHDRNMMNEVGPARAAMFRSVREHLRARR